VLKDSGTRREFKGGAVRDAAKMKGRFDLLAIGGVIHQGLQMERGAAKYSARNWEKGMPLSVFFSSAMDHLFAFVQGFDDEPHIDAAIWNLSCLAETELRIKMGILPKELDDLPKTFRGRDFQAYMELARNFKTVGSKSIKKKAHGRK
jgi:hypothetical protein